MPNHLLSTDPTDLPVEAAEAAELRGRIDDLPPDQVLPVEVIVRGYVAGSGWKDYRRTGVDLRDRCRPGSARAIACRSRS